MIESKRIILKKVESKNLLDHILTYFRNNVNGKVLRFAIVEVKGKNLVLDVSVRTE
jgi:hypothetical protein